MQPPLLPCDCTMRNTARRPAPHDTNINDINSSAIPAPTQSDWSTTHSEFNEIFVNLAYIINSLLHHSSAVADPDTANCGGARMSYQESKVSDSTPLRYFIYFKLHHDFSLILLNSPFSAPPFDLMVFMVGMSPCPPPDTLKLLT